MRKLQIWNQINQNKANNRDLDITVKMRYKMNGKHLYNLQTKKIKTEQDQKIAEARNRLSKDLMQYSLTMKTLVPKKVLRINLKNKVQIC